VEVGPPQRVLTLMRKLLERGYIVLPSGAPPSVLCLTPPLCISDAQLEGFARALQSSLAELS
jgi:4-aminobutyrate aminotransferase-like enzyme